MTSLVLRGSIFNGHDYMEAGCVVVDQSQGVIVEVGRKGDVNEPKDVRVLDIPGSTILPGF
jgi:imidazolonepropionase-like amidohydrolase